MKYGKQSEIEGTKKWLSELQGRVTNKTTKCKNGEMGHDDTVSKRGISTTYHTEGISVDIPPVDVDLAR